MNNPATPPKADDSTRLVPQLPKPPTAPGTPSSGPVAPGAGAPVIPRPPMPSAAPPAGGAASKSPLASLPQSSAASEGPQKRRLMAGVVVAGSVAALALFSSFKTDEDPAAEGSEKPEEAAGASGHAGGADHAAAHPTTAASSAADTPVVINTDRPVANTVVDDLSIEDARDIARLEAGPDAFFKWHNQIHTTTTEEEFEAKTPDERASFVGSSTWHENHPEGQSTLVNGLQMTLDVPFLQDEEIWKMSSHTDTTTGHTDYYLSDSEGHGKLLENVSKDEYGGFVRTDPETHEVTPFNPTVILDQVADGKIDVQFYPSDVDIVDGTPSVEPVDVSIVNPHEPYVDPYLVVHTPSEEAAEVPAPAPAALPTDELLSNKLHEIADEAGIDEVHKIKTHESGDGWDYKIKGDDGEKVKGHISAADLHQPATPVHEDAPTPEPTHENTAHDTQLASVHNGHEAGADPADFAPVHYIEHENGLINDGVSPYGFHDAGTTNYPAYEDDNA